MSGHQSDNIVVLIASFEELAHLSQVVRYCTLIRLSVYYDSDFFRIGIPFTLTAVLIGYLIIWVFWSGVA